MSIVRLPNGERVCWEILAVVREFWRGSCRLRGAFWRGCRIDFGSSEFLTQALCTQKRLLYACTVQGLNLICTKLAGNKVVSTTNLHCTNAEDLLTTLVHKEFLVMVEEEEEKTRRKKVRDQSRNRQFNSRLVAASAFVFL
jgi:hypothetical protein